MTVLINDFCNILEIGQFVTKITLDHKLVTGLTEQIPVRRTTPPTVFETNRPRPTDRPFTVTRVPPTQRPQPRPVQTPPPDSFEEGDCGNPDSQLQLTTGLIVHGNNVRRGQFPW